jgi:Ca2+-transporting ATPase
VTPRDHWHHATISETLAALDSRADGLTAADAAARLQQYGPNRLQAAPPASALRIIAAQFTSMMVLLLTGAAALSLALGDRVESLAIAIVIILNAALGFAIELRARRAMESLQRLQASRASTMRDGHLVAISAETLVPGDVVELNAGQIVPADGRIISSHDLRTNEAALTGESLPVSKLATAVLPEDTLLAERTTMVYKGTTVAAGTGRMAVTATGAATEVGRIGALTASVREERTPLELRLDALGRRLVWLALAIAAIVAALGISQGRPLLLMLETGVALAVAAVPEGLPAVATIALAVGLRRMARRHALVRRLPAVETLGSTTVVCTDKTRTLTSGKMSVARVWTNDGAWTPVPSGQHVEGDLRSALECAALATRPQAAGSSAADGTPTGDPVDVAIIQAAANSGIDVEQLHGRPVAAYVPFSSERKFMAAFHRSDGQLTVHVKGAPRRILEMSSRQRSAAGDRVLGPADHERLLAMNAQLAGSGLRVLGVAEGDVAEASEGALRELTFVGYIGLMDPPAPGVKEAIATLRQAGLRTIVLTGDQRFTAEAIGRDLGVLTDRDEALDGRELQALSSDALQERIGRVGTFSRISPEDKLTIVRALRRQGEIVAMLGDGVNDAPALRQADVGVAMGIRGTDVAKEAAAIVLQDDRFETIAVAVEEGRVIFDNIRKFVFYLFSCNLAEILVLLVAGLLRLPLPLLPLQILWLNLVTDTFPALALAMEPGDVDVMQRPPRDPHEAILSRSFLSSVFAYGALIAGATLAAFVWASNWAATEATTVAFLTLALAQVFHLGNARSPGAVLERGTALANRYALGAVLLCVLLQILSVYVTPLAGALHLVRPGLQEWMVVLACSAAPAILGQAFKTFGARPL